MNENESAHMTSRCCIFSTLYKYDAMVDLLFLHRSLMAVRCHLVIEKLKMSRTYRYVDRRFKDLLYIYFKLLYLQLSK